MDLCAVSQLEMFILSHLFIADCCTLYFLCTVFVVVVDVVIHSQHKEQITSSGNTDRISELTNLQNWLIQLRFHVPLDTKSASWLVRRNINLSSKIVTKVIMALLVVVAVVCCVSYQVGGGTATTSNYSAETWIEHLLHRRRRIRVAALRQTASSPKLSVPRMYFMSWSSLLI